MLCRCAPRQAHGPTGGTRAQHWAEFVHRGHHRQVAGLVDRIAQQGRIFLNVDDQQRLVGLALESVLLAGELGHVQRLGAVWVELGSPLLSCEDGQVSGLALAPPGAQKRRVDALAAPQGADLAGLGAAVGSRQDSALVGVGKCPASCIGDDLGAGVRLEILGRRSGRIFSRPAGSLRCTRTGQTLQGVHRCLGSHLVAH